MEAGGGLQVSGGLDDGAAAAGRCGRSADGCVKIALAGGSRREEEDSMAQVEAQAQAQAHAPRDGGHGGMDGVVCL